MTHRLLAALALISLSGPSSALAAKEMLPSWGLEIKFGPYQPQASTDPTQREYFELMYTSPDSTSLFKNRPLLTAIEASWYLSDRFGLLGLNFGVGRWGITGVARDCTTEDSLAACTPETVFDSQPGATPIGLSVIPFTLGGVYRMDLIKRHWPVPLVPYVKGGVDLYLWQATAAGQVTEVNGEKGQGLAYGFHGALGLALNLDFLEPKVATRAASAMGLVDSYVFFEARKLWGNSLGDQTRFDTSGMWYSLGLAVDFR